MRSRLTTAIFFILLIGFIQGCQLASVGDPIVVSDIEEEFYLDLKERLGPDQRSLILEVRTIEPKPCKNYLIRHRVERSGSFLSVSLNDIVEPEDCAPGEAPAQSDVLLGVLNPDYYQLSVDLKQAVINQGQLRVRTGSYHVEMDTEDGIVWLHNELIRIPEQTLWGYLSHSGSAAAEQATTTFLEELRAIVAPKTLNTGYYGHFTISGDTRQLTIHDLPEEAAKNLRETFVFQYQDQIDAVRALAKRYRKEYDEVIQLQIFTDRGEVI